MRTPAQVQKSLAGRISSANPSADTVKGPIAESVIMPVGAEISDVEQRQDRIAFRYSTEYIKTQDREAQLLYGSNHGLRPSPGGPSTVRGVAYTYTRPTTDVPIPAGKLVSTMDGTISFRIAYPTVMWFNRLDSYFNAVKRRYEVPVTLVSVGVGSAFDLAPTIIRNLRDTIAGIDGVENTARAQNALPEEDLTAFGRRTQAKFNGLDQTSEDGLRQLLMNYAPTFVRDVIPVFSSDTQYFQRRTRRAAWDLYILGERIEDTEATFTATGGSVFQLPGVPVTSVTDVSINGLSVPFTFVQDTNPATRGSILATDSVALSYAPTSGSTVTVSYEWNALITQLNDYVNARGRQAYKTDILVRTTQDRPLNVTVVVQVLSTFDTSTVLSDVEAAVYDFFDLPDRRSLLVWEDLRTYIKQTVVGIRDITVPLFQRADVGSMPVEVIDLAPYDRASVSANTLTITQG